VTIAGLVVAVPAAIGLVSYDLYLLNQINQLNKQNTQAEALIEQQEQLLREIQEDRREETKAYAKVAEKRDSKTCCRFIWDDARLGGNADHNTYTSRLFSPNYELIVTAPDGDTARYDSGSTFPEPVTAAYEAKTGRIWAATVPRPQWIPRMEKEFAKDMLQFARQQRVATKCKLSYSIYFRDELGFRGYSREAPAFAPHCSFRP